MDSRIRVWCGFEGLMWRLRGVELVWDVPQRAIEEGADFIESDITATKDGKLICFHDLVLDYVTDVASHSEFVDRIRTYEAEGELVTGFFSGGCGDRLKLCIQLWFCLSWRSLERCLSDKLLLLFFCSGLHSGGAQDTTSSPTLPIPRSVVQQ